MTLFHVYEVYFCKPENGEPNLKISALNYIYFITHFYYYYYSLDIGNVNVNRNICLLSIDYYYIMSNKETCLQDLLENLKHSLTLCKMIY